LRNRTVYCVLLDSTNKTQILGLAEAYLRRYIGVFYGPDFEGFYGDEAKTWISFVLPHDTNLKDLRENLQSRSGLGYRIIPLK